MNKPSQCLRRCRAPRTAQEGFILRFYCLFVVCYIKFAILIVVIAVCFGDLAYHVAGISKGEHVVRDVAGHDRTGADHDIVSDRYTRHDTDVAADPDIVTDRDIDTVLISGVSRLRVKRVPGRAEHDIRATHTSRTTKL